MNTAERLVVDLALQPNGCLEWNGSRTRGYGQFTLARMVYKTHRLAWELAFGPIPDGMAVCHYCDNPPCCQTQPTEGYPKGHLFLGTRKQNSADMIAKGRHFNQSKTHCKNGHEFTPENTFVRPASGYRNCVTCRRESQRV